MIARDRTRLTDPVREMEKPALPRGLFLCPLNDLAGSSGAGKLFFHFGFVLAFVRDQL